jgi:Tol biopolymer transport system component
MHEIVHAPAPPLVGVPPRLADIVDKALAKDPRDRYQNAGDLAVDLRRLLSKTDSHALAAPSSAGRARPVRWIVAALVLVAAGVAAWFAFRSVADPLENAKFDTLTNWPGDEYSPALSPNGEFAVFFSDRDGNPRDVYLTQVGTGQLPQKFRGGPTELQVPLVGSRPLGFTGDSSEIRVGLNLIPLLGGVPRPLLAEGAFLDWSPDGKRMVYVRSDVGGDPVFVADNDGFNPTQIFVDVPGMHNHTTTWSPDGRWIYFVHGRAPFSNMDLYRIHAEGGQPEQLTTFNRFIGSPTPIDARTVLYVGEDEDGCGPWLWAFDVERKVSRRVTKGLDKYLWISAASRGHRLIASRANPEATLWSVPILDRIAEESDVNRYPVPTARAHMPRFGGKSLFYLSSQGCRDGLWQLDGGQPRPIWKDSKTALLEPPAVTRDGGRAAVVSRQENKQSLLLINTDGSQKRPIAETLQVQGAATWSPDGKWIAVGGNDGKGSGLFKIPVDGGLPVPLTTDGGSNPVWSPDGTLIAYMGKDVSQRQPLLAVRPNGEPVRLPSIEVPAGGERIQFLPDGKGLVYIKVGRDFWMLNLTTLESKRLTNLKQSAIMRTFDITPDGKQIVFDRLPYHSDIVVIDLPKQADP